MFHIILKNFHNLTTKYKSSLDGDEMHTICKMCMVLMYMYTIQQNAHNVQRCKKQEWKNFDVKPFLKVVIDMQLFYTVPRVLYSRSTLVTTAVNFLNWIKAYLFRVQIHISVSYIRFLQIESPHAVERGSNSWNCKNINKLFFLIQMLNAVLQQEKN